MERGGGGEAPLSSLQEKENEQEIYKSMSKAVLFFSVSNSYVTQLIYDFSFTILALKRSFRF